MLNLQKFHQILEAPESFHHLGAAALLSRSFIAIPIPSSGIGDTAIFQHPFHLTCAGNQINLRQLRLNLLLGINLDHKEFHQIQGLLRFF